MTTEKIRTAVLIDKNNNPVPVHARLWEDCDGETWLGPTRKQIIEENPGLTWDGWVYDIHNEDHMLDLCLCFLSPNVFSIKRWVYDGNKFEFRKITSEEVFAVQDAIIARQ